jgi:hypothetical protein
MNIESSPQTPILVQSHHAASPAAQTASSILMTCDVCDLVGGPFPAAEAAHLRAIHDRLHHGIMAA